MQRRTTERASHLYTLAENQGGYFTSSDAKALGYDYPHQHFHVKQGNWLRAGHGIYRLKHFPPAEHQDLIRWWLWSRKKGVISHETAAAVYDLGDLLPSKVHLIVSPDFRKRVIKGVALHKGNLEKSEIEKRHGFSVTTPLRTIMDLARMPVDPERLTAVVNDAVERGLVVRRDLLNLLSKMSEGIDPSIQATLQLALTREAPNDYGVSSEVQARTGQIREAVGLFQTKTTIEGLLIELKSGLKVIYGRRLRGVYLFGSYARGEADRESDLDILVVLGDFERYAREVDRTSELASDLSLKHSVSVSLVFMREQEWLRGDTPFLSNVRDEAIPA